MGRFRIVDGRVWLKEMEWILWLVYLCYCGGAVGDKGVRMGGDEVRE